jgi:tetratricopeptide (TPR) repeat protein
LKNNSLESAADHFQKTLAIAPDDAMARMLLGYVRLKQESMRMRSRPCNRRRFPVPAGCKNARHHSEQHRHGLLEQQTVPACPARLRTGSQTRHNYADARYNLAFALLSQGRAKDAVPHFDVLIKNNPRDPLLHDGPRPGL